MLGTFSAKQHTYRGAFRHQKFRLHQSHTLAFGHLLPEPSFIPWPVLLSRLYGGLVTIRPTEPASGLNMAIFAAVSLALPVF